MRSFVEVKRTTWTPEWIKQEYLPYGEKFRAARQGMRKQYNKCKACGHKFEDGEMMALAGFGKKGNQTLCQTCACDLDT